MPLIFCFLILLMSAPYKQRVELFVPYSCSFSAHRHDMNLYRIIVFIDTLEVNFGAFHVTMFVSYVMLLAYLFGHITLHVRLSSREILLSLASFHFTIHHESCTSSLILFGQHDRQDYIKSAIITLEKQSDPAATSQIPIDCGGTL